MHATTKEAALEIIGCVEGIGIALDMTPEQIIAETSRPT